MHDLRVCCCFNRKPGREKDKSHTLGFAVFRKIVRPWLSGLTFGAHVIKTALLKCTRRYRVWSFSGSPVKCPAPFLGWSCSSVCLFPCVESIPRGTLAALWWCLFNHLHLEKKKKVKYSFRSQSNLWEYMVFVQLDTLFIWSTERNLFWLLRKGKNKQSVQVIWARKFLLSEKSYKKYICYIQKKYRISTTETRTMFS